uniref:Uncharacterized protein n=1 Tax=Romanomermis culicivorax TaxID=13658 RepID=A0A915HKS1_ROMCU
MGPTGKAYVAGLGALDFWVFWAEKVQLNSSQEKNEGQNFNDEACDVDDVNDEDFNKALRESEESYQLEKMLVSETQEYFDAAQFDSSHYEEILAKKDIEIQQHKSSAEKYKARFRRVLALINECEYKDVAELSIECDQLKKSIAEYIKIQEELMSQYIPVSKASSRFSFESGCRIPYLLFLGRFKKSW